MFTRVVIIVLHPPVITMTIRLITISLLLSIRGTMTLDYLGFLLRPLLALLLLLLVLPPRGLLLQPDDLLLQVLVAPRWSLGEMLDRIIISSCSEAFSTEIYTLFSHNVRSIVDRAFYFYIVVGNFIVYWPRQTNGCFLPFITLSTF